MLKDELLEQLKNLKTDIGTIQLFWNRSTIDARLSELEKEEAQENFWQHPTLAKELQKLRQQKQMHIHIVNTFNELPELIELFENEPHELTALQQNIHTLTKEIKQLKVELLLNQDGDNEACFLIINAGAGGTESQDWAEILLRMYVRFCEQQKFPVNIIDYQPAEEAGIKSASLFITGKNAYGLLKGEHGIHRLVRISPFDANKRRHTSFAGVTVIREAPQIIVNIDQNDLRIDTYRASGAGGQHVNKTESAVRITHIPSGIVVQCQNERSQQQNKETAFKMLHAKLAQKLQEEADAKRSASIEKKKIEWGAQIRSYVLHPYKMVKDHRTDHESPQPELVLDGQLIDFIEAFLIWHSTNQAAA